jgi:hypothetical protein
MPQVVPKYVLQPPLDGEDRMPLYMLQRPLGSEDRVPLYTPQPPLDSEDRVEADQTIDGETDYCHQPNDHYAEPPLELEAPIDLSEIRRTAPNVYRPRIWENTETRHAQRLPPPSARPREQARRAKRPVPRNHYRIGQAIARLFTGVGWLVVAAGLALPFALLVPVLAAAHYGVLVGGSASALFVGLLIVSLGHAARARYDRTNAMRELLAYERAKWFAEQP